MKKLLLSLPLVAFALLGTVALASPPGPGYHLIKKVSLGAAPGGGEYFDYVTVDSAARRVYLSHGAEVKVLDADNFSVVGTISGLKRCHGVVVLPDLGKGFITDGDAETVAVFDLKTLKITGEIKSSPDTDSITYDPASKLIFTFNGDSKNSTVIDPVKETVVKVIDMGGAVEQPVADGKGTLYDNNEEKNDVAVVDTHTLAVKARCPSAPVWTPTSSIRKQGCCLSPPAWASSTFFMRIPLTSSRKSKRSIPSLAPKQWVSIQRRTIFFWPPRILVRLLLQRRRIPIRSERRFLERFAY